MPGLLPVEIPAIPITLTILITLLFWIPSCSLLSSNFQGRSLAWASFVVVVCCTFFLVLGNLSPSIGNLLARFQVPLIVIGAAGLYQFYRAAQPAFLEGKRTGINIVAILIFVIGFIFSYLPPTSSPRETLLTPFTGGRIAVKTQYSYESQTTIEVSGVGQALDLKWSDAFYTFTLDETGQALSPSYPNDGGGILCINGMTIDHFIQPPPSYKSDHNYTFTINAPGGQLTFGVADYHLDNNSGAYTILIL